jgi:hypothetical protein
MSDLIPKHGGYRKLKSFQIAQLVYDVTVRFCDCYIDKFSRTKKGRAKSAFDSSLASSSRTAIRVRIFIGHL